MNRLARSSLVALLVASGLGASAVLAQQAPPAPSANDDGGGGRRGGRRGGDGAGGERRADRGARRAEIRERVQQKIQSYLAVELASRAGLDQTKSVQLGTAIKAHMERKQKAHQARRADMEKLRSLVDTKGNDAAVKSQLKSVVEPEGARDLQAFLDDTSKFLTPTEQAKVVLALPEVMKDARQLVREARGKRRGGGDR